MSLTRKSWCISGKHSNEIAAYASASQYLKDHLNGYNKVPEKEWRAERDKLLAQRRAHVDAYYKIKDDVRSIEILKRGAESIMWEEPTTHRTQDIHL